MTIDEAIKHAEEVAREHERNCDLIIEGESKEINRKCSEEHRQLAEWLKDYKRLLEQEPCEDAVSRKMATAHLTKARMTGDSRPMEDIFSELPSVQPQTVDWDGMIEEIKLNTIALVELFDDERFDRYGMFEDDILDIINKYRNGGAKGEMMEKLLEWTIRKLVTLYYRKFPFLTYSWGIDDYTDIHIISEEWTDDTHRMGLSAEGI